MYVVYVVLFCDDLNVEFEEVEQASADTDQTAHRSSLIWVCIVCPCARIIL